MSFDAYEFLQGLFGLEAHAGLPPEWVEEYEERAGILVFDGGLRRDHAETEARQEIRKRIKDLEEIGTSHLKSTGDGI
ncbi:MAG: hypothetical protein ACYTEX_27215 [Planctomycetota bacterium]